MFTRTLTSILMIGLLTLVLFLGDFALGAVIALFCVIGIYELYKATENGGNKPLKWVALLFSIPIIVYTFDLQMDISQITAYAIAAIVFMICIMNNKKYSVVDAVITIAAGVVVFSMFFSIQKIYKIGMDSVESACLILLCLIGAFITDTFAYLVGITIGKHKLCPSISPKKSVEGSIGGIIAVTAVMTLYGHFVLNSTVSSFADTPSYKYIILGLICGVVSQVGDLAASMIKRHYNIKDYGNIFPGHGGILDRFDSLTFVAPMVYFFINMTI